MIRIMYALIIKTRTELHDVCAYFNTLVGEFYRVTDNEQILREIDNGGTIVIYFLNGRYNGWDSSIVIDSEFAYMRSDFKVIVLETKEELAVIIKLGG